VARPHRRRDERILDHLGRGGESLDPLDPAHPSRGPPQGELSL
jgi:hypothetical protein